jgi:quinone-modifying oxidoreductase subunit QmoC
MLFTQWGLKEKVLGDPDIWLCHQCNDCSVHCPQGAKPGDVLATLRSMAIEHFSFPRFLAKFFANPSSCPGVRYPGCYPLALVAALRASAT